MSRHAYPRIRRAQLKTAWVKLAERNPSNAPKCTVIGCGRPAHYFIDIAISGLISEDEEVQACPAHQTATHALLTGLAKNQADLAARKGSP